MIRDSNIFIAHPAHIILGDTNISKQYAIANLQKILCVNQSGCKECYKCIQVATFEHASIAWYNPEQSYTLEDIDRIIQQCSLQRSTKNPYFIILEKAHLLSVACNNRLLKIVEEPPIGYHFIFCAMRSDTILNTLISRCFVHNLDQTSSNTKYYPFTALFENFQYNRAIEAIRLLDSLEIKEQESKEIIDLLIEKTCNALKNEHQQREPNITNMIQHAQNLALLTQALKQLPATGSAKIFWKNMILAWHNNI